MFSSIRDRSYHTSTQLKAPFKNPIEFSKEKATVAEVTVTDPRHPLFGRCFPVLSSIPFPTNRQYIEAIYKDHIPFRLPISATNLGNNFCLPLAKLSHSCIEDLISLAQECNLLCPKSPIKSGSD